MRGVAGWAGWLAGPCATTPTTRSRDGGSGSSRQEGKGMALVDASAAAAVVAGSDVYLTPPASASASASRTSSSSPLAHTTAAPAFELLVVGCGGGPVEGNMSCYLLKPAARAWATAGATALDAGCAIGALANVLQAHARHPAHGSSSSSSSSSSSDLLTQLGVGVVDDDTPDPAHWQRAATHVWSLIQLRLSLSPFSFSLFSYHDPEHTVWKTARCFAISHAHLDHVSGLILASACSRSSRPLYAHARTLANLANAFDGGLWPRLAGPERDGQSNGRAYRWRELDASSTVDLMRHPRRKRDDDDYIQDDDDDGDYGELDTLSDEEDRPRTKWRRSARVRLSTGLDMVAFPVSHGMDPSRFHRNKPSKQDDDDDDDEDEAYDSAAFLIRDRATRRELVFFGDVEPDSLSARPRNVHVWRAVARRVADGRLSAILLECSYPSSQPTDQLWGHLSPPHVLDELETLARLVCARRRKRQAAAQRQAEDREREGRRLPLEGVTVIVTHIKDDVLPLPTTSCPPPPAAAPAPAVVQEPPAKTLDDEVEVPVTPVTASMTTTAALSPPGPSSLSAEQRHLALLSMSPPIPSAQTSRRRSSGGSIYTNMNLFGSGSVPGAASPGGAHHHPHSRQSGRRASSALSLGPLARRGRSTSLSRGPHAPESSSSSASPAAGALERTSPKRTRTVSLAERGSSSAAQDRRVSMSMLQGANPFATARAPSDEAATNKRRAADAGREQGPEEEGEERKRRRVEEAAVADEPTEEDGSGRSEADDGSSASGGEIEIESVQATILRELNELERERQTGVRFLIAQQGMRIFI